ncbi:MAG TPA: GNAT family N-acetyltransferase [Chthonomonadaceae bacterium]|nr:GNAT family N-acetyltransferase [Chthonomonadaceae bacterium]
MADPELQVTAKEGYFHHELRLNGESVSSLAVNDLVMRIGRATVRMGGIGGVGTKWEHRKKGYARRVLENSNIWMEANGFDCATLFGIEDFYDKFGYAVCLTDSRSEVQTRDAERAAASLSVRPFAQDDLPAVRDIYAANNATLNGSIVRNDRTRWFRKGSRYDTGTDVCVFTNETGEVVAYAARDASRDRVTVCEVGVRRPEYYADITRWAAEYAVQLRVENITFMLPPDSLCAAFLTQYGARQALRFPRNGEGMGRILHLGRFIKKTLPEWTHRAEAAREIAPGTALRLETDIGSITLRWTGTALEMDDTARASGTVRLPQWRLMQLAMGYYDAELTLSFPEVEALGDLSLLYTLFPRRLGYMWTCDHF